MYIIYKTDETSIVVRNIQDGVFPVADMNEGGYKFVKSYKDLKQYPSFMLIKQTDNIKEAIKYDDGEYPRITDDRIELNLYNYLLKLRLESKRDISVAIVIFITLISCI